MVDINYLYNDDFVGSNLSSVHSNNYSNNIDNNQVQTILNCKDSILNDDYYLENIDESDLLNFNNNTINNNNSIDIDTNDTNQFFIETPPETPVNYNSLSYSVLSSLNNNFKDINANNLCKDKFELENFNDFLDNSSASSISSSNSSTISIGSPIANNLLSPTISICSNNSNNNSCLSSPTSTLNNQRISNGYANLDNIITRNNKIFDNHYISKKNNIPPKIILPNKIFNNKLIIPTIDLSNNQCKEKLKLQKLEARKLRNREAALQSRLKKQEYVENLELKINELKKENNDLLLENALLKQKINDIEHELFKIKNISNLNSSSSSYGMDSGKANNPNKARLGYFAIIFMVVFQVSPYIMSISSDDNRKMIMTDNKNINIERKSIFDNNDIHLSRQLLGLKYNKRGIPDNEYFELQNDNNNFNLSSNDKIYYRSNIDNDNINSTKCDNYFNRTELIRLENELRDWLTRFKSEENNFKRNYLQMHQRTLKKQNAKKLLYDLKHVPIPRLKLWMQKQRYIDYLNDELMDQNHQQEQLNSIDQFFPFDFENLMSTIHRRDDTFYYLSYPSKGHLILPPLSNRTNIRPRFSFLIPTFYNFSPNNSANNINISNNNNNSNQTNETVSPSLALPKLFMLQIDCQVINTKVTLANVDSNFRNKSNNVVVDNKNWKKTKTKLSHNNNNNKNNYTT